MTTRSKSPPLAGRRKLTDADVVRIEAATFLTICAAMANAGVARLEHLSSLLLSQIDEDDVGAWTEVLKGLAGVLERDGAAPDRSSPHSRPALRVVEGGLGRVIARD